MEFGSFLGSWGKHCAWTDSLVLGWIWYLVWCPRFAAGRRRMPRERIAKHLSERAPTGAGHHVNIHDNVHHKLCYK